MEKPKAIALFSGGKDSVYSLQASLVEYEVVALVSIMADTGDIHMTDGAEVEKSLFDDLISLLPFSIEKIVVRDGGNYLSDVVCGVKEVLEKYGTRIVITGDLGHPDGIDKVLEKELEVLCVSPANDFIQEFGAEAYLEDLTDKKISFLLLGVRNNILPNSYIGKSFNQETIDALKHRNIDLAGEDGEYQTLVVDTPIMKSSLKIDSFLLETSKGRDNKGYIYTRMKDVVYSILSKS